MQSPLPSWRPLSADEFPADVIHQSTLEYPDVRLLESFLIRAFEAQGGGARETADEIDEFRRWLSYQQMEGSTSFPLRKWPRLESMLFATFSDKVSQIAQRTCRLCHGARSAAQLSGAAFMALRITPISRQVKTPGVFKAYQAAIASRLAGRDHFPLDATGCLCLAITFVLKRDARDRDLDNMTKALQDAVARASGFNDRNVHHLDVLKLIFPATDEFVCLRIAPSALNEHEEVLVKATAHSWAGQPKLRIEDFMP